MEDPSAINSLITGGFSNITVVLLVVFGSAFTLVGLVVAARAGIAWLRRIGQRG